MIYMLFNEQGERTYVYDRRIAATSKEEKQMAHLL